MTAKQELLDLVQRMDEREAHLALTEWKRRHKDAVRRPSGRPSLLELSRMPAKEREEYLSRFPAGIEYEESLEWDRALVRMASTTNERE